MKIILVVLLCLIATGCADSVSFEAAKSIEQVGFLHGLWHGMIFPISFIVSLFSDDTAVYAIYNNGGWYDFGFYVGLGSSVGGTGRASKR